MQTSIAGCPKYVLNENAVENPETHPALINCQVYGT
jgi:hypothetical protein